MEVSTRETFAESIGMAARGGAFGYLVGSMAMYGLVETGGGNIRLTDLAKVILHGEPEEAVITKDRAVRNISLFEEIYERFGVNFTEDQLRLFLREKAGADISQATTLAAEINKILRRDLQFLMPKNAGQKQTGPTATRMRIAGTGEAAAISLPDDVIATVQSHDFGVLTIKDEIGADIALKMIEALKERIKQKKAGDAEEGEKRG